MITSRANARLKALRRARRGRGDAVLIEGPHLLGEALGAGLRPMSVLATPAFLASAVGSALAGRLPSPPIEAEPSLLDELADSDSPRGIVALVDRPRRALEAIPRIAGGRYVLADGVQDPGNLGALARVAEASGATALVLMTGCADPDHPRSLRASAGSLLRLSVATRVSVADLVAYLEDPFLEDLAPIVWAGLVAHQGAPLYETALDGTLVIAIGGEGHGLSPEVEGRLDLRLTIPMAGAVESLNLATAAAVALFELARRGGQPPAGAKRTANSAGHSLPVR